MRTRGRKGKTGQVLSADRLASFALNKALKLRFAAAGIPYLRNQLGKEYTTLWVCLSKADVKVSSSDRGPRSLQGPD